MIRTRTMIGAAAAAALVSGLAVSAQPAGATDVRPTTAVTMGGGGFITMPTQLHPGRAHFTVTSGNGHSHDLQLARPKYHTGTPMQLIADIRAFGNTGKALALEAHFTAHGGVRTGRTFWTVLHTGTYYAFDSDLNPATMTTADVAVVHVSGSVRNAPVSSNRPTVTAIHEMDWSDLPASMPHIASVHFVNLSTDWHFLILQRVKAGTTDADIQAVFDGKKPGSQVFLKENTDSGVISSGQQMTMAFALPPGDYAMLCFWPDDETGEPHALMGMHRVIHLT